MTSITYICAFADGKLPTLTAHQQNLQWPGTTAAVLNRSMLAMSTVLTFDIFKGHEKLGKPGVPKVVGPALSVNTWQYQKGRKLFITFCDARGLWRLETIRDSKLKRLVENPKTGKKERFHLSTTLGCSICVKN